MKVLKMLGRLQTSVSESMFSQCKNNGDSATTSLNQCMNKFMGMFGESTNGLLNETIIKQLTGDDAVSLRFLYKESFETTLHMKLVLIGNDKPLWRGTAPMINRVAFFNFVNKFVDNPQKKHHRKKDDALVNDLLTKDKDQIFTLLIQNASLLYKKRTITPSKFIEKEFKKYISEIDTTGQFLDLLTPTPKTGLTAKTVHEMYCQWCAENNKKSERKGDFVAKLKKRYKPRANKLHNNIVYDIGFSDEIEVSDIDDIDIEHPEIMNLKDTINIQAEEIKKLKKQLKQTFVFSKDEKNFHVSSNLAMMKKLHNSI
jgi:phage/plasmid-associated DNA primase